jgi:ubiquinone/menaquinone biosynthesis C-methylase UbiE
MRLTSLELLRCPHCGAPLSLDPPAGSDDVSDGRLTSHCGRSFAIVDGIPDLVFPPAQPYVDENAENYDALTAFIGELLRADEAKVRREAVGFLELAAGERVLEVACGTGANFPALLDAVGPSGEVHALDICPRMLQMARRKLALRSASVELYLANGVHLPFADDAFDALLHIGTLNRFPDVERALAEMARVVKIGGRILAADEGLAPWLEDSEYASILKKFGNLFVGEPPLAALPAEARDVQLRWFMGDAYFAIVFRVGEGARTLNLDTTLPGRTVTVRDVLEAVKKNDPVRE